jgi:regulator of sigma E protease
MAILDYIIPFVVGLGILIAVHEYGHYWVARRCGVKVLRFSIGFGRPLVKWAAGRDQTEWAIGAFPLGGYVKMLDEREGLVPPAELHRAFNRQSVGKRMAIVAAGPLANLLLAVLVYWGLNVAGVDELRARINLVDGPSAALTAGLEDGDLIEAVEDEPVQSWQDLRWAMLNHVLDGNSVKLQVERPDGSEKSAVMDLAGFELDDSQTDLLVRLGMQPFRAPIPAVVGKLAEGSAALRAGMQEGDRVLEIEGAPIAHWAQLVAKVRTSAGVPLRFAIMRAGQRLELMITPDEVEDRGEQVGRIGVAVAIPPEGQESMFIEVRYGVLGGFTKALSQTWETSALSVSLIGRMITGQVSVKNLSGPVTIANYAGQSARVGPSAYLKFLALISISLGVLNLLPIPVLDGGHLLYYAIEFFKGGPIPQRIMEIGQQVGLALLVMLMAFAIYNDINRLISG